MEETFSTRAVPRRYNQDQSAVSVTELLELRGCELLLLESARWGRRQSGNPQEGERPLLEAATKQRQSRRDSGQ
jgi:hypothetical protein